MERQEFHSIDQEDVKCNTHPASTTRQKSGPTTFFSLSAELRTRIYEEALIEPRPHRVEVTADLKEPGLLSTCRQIRAESLKIYYLRNVFHIWIRSCDASLYGAFYRHTAKYNDAEKSQRVRFRTSCASQNNWGNLISWCRKIHAGRCPGPEPHLDHGTGAMVRAAVTGIAKEGREMSWESCERAIRWLRPLAGHIDQNWKK